jgi:hypothetical protein
VIAIAGNDGDEGGAGNGGTGGAGAQGIVVVTTWRGVAIS